MSKTSRGGVAGGEISPDSTVHRSSPDVRALIQQLESICPLPAGGDARIASLVRVRHLRRGEYFVRAGERPTCVGFLVEGWLRYYYTDAEGRRFVRYFCCGGHFVASLSALTSGQPSAYSIEAIEDARLVAFSYRDWLELLETNVVWGSIHRTLLEQALMRAEERERSLILDDAATRYRRFLVELPGAEQHIRQYDIANYLGISPVSLSRIRRAQAKARASRKLA